MRAIHPVRCHLLHICSCVHTFMWDKVLRIVHAGRMRVRLLQLWHALDCRCLNKQQPRVEAGGTSTMVHRTDAVTQAQQ